MITDKGYIDVLCPSNYPLALSKKYDSGPNACKFETIFIRQFVDGKVDIIFISHWSLDFNPYLRRII